MPVIARTLLMAPCSLPWEVGSTRRTSEIATEAVRCPRGEEGMALKKHPTARRRRRSSRSPVCRRSGRIGTLRRSRNGEQRGHEQARTMLVLMRRRRGQDDVAAFQA